MSASSAITVEICLKDGSEKHFNYKVDDNKAPENSYLSEMSQTIRAAQKEVNEFLTEIVDKEKSEKNGASTKIVEIENNADEDLSEDKNSGSELEPCQKKVKT